MSGIGIGTGAGGGVRENGMRVSALEIAAALGRPAPTPQQIAVIEAPLEPAIVVAGAGSGKTETMANRVVWLIANGLVDISGVLGLTFTRKAARELSMRIRERVEQLAASDLAAVEVDAFDRVGVSTYNAFASSVYRENALLIGREPDATLLGEAAAWQLARRIVANSQDERLVSLPKSVDQITEATLMISREVSENLADPAVLSSFAERFVEIAGLPTSSANGRTKSVGDAVDAVAPLPSLIELAAEFEAVKVRRGLIEFSDQVALALRIVERVPSVAEGLRAQYPIVLLDEYQDTSVVQTRFLATIFQGRAVMAVGDPHQSIYGWRGASASNLSRFARDFAPEHPEAVTRFALSTSWRNATRVLDAANVVASPLTATSPIQVETLDARPGAPVGRIDVAWQQNVLDEAEDVAIWLAERMLPGPRASADFVPPSAAMLCRTVQHIRPFTDALTRHGVDYHVLGIGGLLGQPVIADLVSALKVVNNPTAGPELLRVLVGARWRIGPRDIRALRSLASWIAARDHAQQPLDEPVVQALRNSVVEDDTASIVDALDFLVTAPPSHRALEGFTEEGLARMRRAGSELAMLRTRVGLDLLDLVVLVQHELLLDVEAAANDTSRHGIASLDAFFEQVTAFADFDERATLGSFLGWLDEAERRDRLSPRSDAPEPGTVQILTIHGSKGLEWDLVAVPRVVADELPAKPRSTRGWLTFGALPYEFRGDAAELPVLGWRDATSQKEFDDAMKAFQGQVRDRAYAEERRLVYVAITRAREHVLLSGSWWSSQTKPRKPSTVITELQNAGLLPGDAIPPCDDEDENPLTAQLVTVDWPLDPLGVRAERVHAAAAAVEAARERDLGWDAVGGYADDLRLLLAERARRAEGETLDVPVRVAASRFKDYVDDPAAVLASLRRPLPERPYRQTRLGTRFHSWVEARGRAFSDADLIDDLIDVGGELDATPDQFDLDLTEPLLDDEQLEQLKLTFESSEWAGRRPAEVELEIHTELAGHVIVCKLDAIYPATDGSHDFQIVDWKTGKPPSDAEDLRSKQLQLALYRLAFSRWKQIDPERVDAVFFYVAENRVIRPERIYSEEELRSLWSSSTGRMPPA